MLVAQNYHRYKELLKMAGRCFGILFECDRFLVIIRVVVTILSIVLPTFSVLFITQTVQLATNYATEVPGATANMAIVSAVCFVGLTALSVVFGSLRSYADQALEDKLNCNLKMALVDKSSRLALQQYEDANTHDIMQRADKQPASRIISTFTTALSIIQSIGESIGVLSILLKWNWIVALLILVSPVPSVVATFILSKNYYRIDFQRATKMREASYFQYLLSSDKTVKEIKAFSLSGYFAKKNAALLKEFLKQDLHYSRLSLAVGGGLNLLGILCYGVGVVVALQQTMTVSAVGQLTGYLQAISSLQTSISVLLSSVSSFVTGILYTSNIFEFLDLPEKKITYGSAEFPHKIKEGIVFRNVNFGYPGTDRAVLSKINFSLFPGETVALVGANGSGKTTIAKLLLRLYEPDSGNITVDGIDISTFNTESLRKGISVLFQDFVKYERTLKDNINFGDIEKRLSKGDIANVLKEAGSQGLLDEIGSEDQMLGRRFPKGRQLSVGQWQKVAFARSLLACSPVLVLDEPTAALDAKSEASLFSHLKDLSWHPTSLVITHRLETIKQADRIIFLQDGKILASGGHNDLLMTCPSYAQMLSQDCDKSVFE